MEQAQVLVSMELDIFWKKMRAVVEEVLQEQDRKAWLTTDGATPQLLKVKDICELFQISKPTVYDWIRRGKLHTVKIESRRFFLVSDVEELIKKHRLFLEKERVTAL